MKMRSLAAALPLTAALIVGATATSASAATTSADPANPSDVSAQEVWEYTGEDFFWQTDCGARAQEMLDSGSILKYSCDGTSSPFDEYSLFVVWNK